MKACARKSSESLFPVVHMHSSSIRVALPFLLKPDSGEKQNRSHVITVSGFEKNLSVSLVLSKRKLADPLSRLGLYCSLHTGERTHEQLDFKAIYGRSSVFAFKKILCQIAPFFDL